MAEGPAPRFGELLRQLRAEAGLTQERLAERARVSARTISDLERGIAQAPHGDTAARLAEGLGLEEPARAWFARAARGPAPALRASDAPGGGAAAVATRTLPRDIASFTGRAGEFARLADGARNVNGVAAIYAVGGMAGIGKTAFAVHAAHQLADSFPDGQLFLPLHGHTLGQRPVAPGDALASLLQTVGVEAAQVPPDLEARARLWRDRLAGRRLLLVLDDAAGSEQVRPLLPGSRECLVLVTSRRRLTALDDAHAVSLDVLPPEEAADLIVRLAGRPGLDPGDPAIGQIAELCEYLPLALGMMARRLHHRPAWTPGDLAAELGAARSRVELMNAEDRSVAAAFSLSYQGLTAGQQQLFRRLGLHPAVDLDARAAAALDDGSPAEAARHLETLYDQHLISEPARGRYRFHGLIRDYAAALAATDDQEQASAATARLLAYYEATAAQASARLARFPRPRPAVPDSPLAGPSLDSDEAALAWLRTERAALLACIGRAGDLGQPGRVAGLTAGLSALLRIEGPWPHARDLQAAAVTAARQAGDPLAEASARVDLGLMRILSGDLRGGGRELRDAARRFRELDSALGEASALGELGAMQVLDGYFHGAAASLERSLTLYRQVGSRQGEADALSELGAARMAIGDIPGAAQVARSGVELSRDLGDGQAEARALQHQGVVQALQGDVAGAAEVFREAARLDHELGHGLGEAMSLHMLGVAQRTLGDHDAARQTNRNVLAMFRELGLRFGEAGAINEMGILKKLAGDLAGAIADQREALRLYISIDARAGQSIAWTELGATLTEAGDLDGAEQALARALELTGGMGVPMAQAGVLNCMGALATAKGHARDALACHQRALDLARSEGHPLAEALSLEAVGRCHLAAGAAAEGITCLRDALEIYRRVGARADADRVFADLVKLADGPEPAGA